MSHRMSTSRTTLSMTRTTPSTSLTNSEMKEHSRMTSPENNSSMVIIPMLSIKITKLTKEPSCLAIITWSTKDKTLITETKDNLLMMPNMVNLEETTLLPDSAKVRLVD